MRNRRTKRKGNKAWTWLSFVLFAFVILLLAGSLITKTTPSAFLSDLFTNKNEKLEYQNQSKKDLVRLMHSRDSTILDLNNELAAMKKRCGLGLATVIVENDALNMRSEPSLNSNIISRIPNGSSVVILEFSQEDVILDGQEGNWVLIEYAGDRGWAWGNYLISRD